MSLLSVLSNGELPLAVRVNDLDHLPHYVRTQADAEAGFDPLWMRTARREGSRGDQERLLQVRTGTAMGLIGSNGSASQL